MTYFLGAGPGDLELLTLKGRRLLEEADVLIWAESLVNPQILEFCKSECRKISSARLSLAQIVGIMLEAHEKGCLCVRLHSGDPALFGAIAEQMDALDARGVPYEVVPGVSSLFGAAAALKKEFTVPNLSQSLIVARAEGRTPVPAGQTLAELSRHGSPMAVFLSAGMIESVSEQLLSGGAFTADTPAAVVYKATWPHEQKLVRGTLGSIARKSREAGVFKSAIIFAGEFLAASEAEKSLLYDENFSTGYRDSLRESEQVQFGFVLILSFSEQGKKVADSLAKIFPKETKVDSCPCFGEKRRDMNCAVAELFERAHSGERCAAIFVGAAGIAVRAAAPYIADKHSDPAVLCVDECCRLAIPLLGGHAGGANALARKISAASGARAAVTTATDLRGAFAVDLWAQRHGVRILNPEAVKFISGAMLAGRPVLASGMELLPENLRSSLPKEFLPCEDGRVPDLAFCLDEPASFSGRTLFLLPKVLALGVGCRRGVPEEKIRHEVQKIFSSAGLSLDCVRAVFSIDAKKDEKGLLEFAASLGVPFQCFSAAELNLIEEKYGNSIRFENSPFVEAAVGAGNVCERAAFLGASGWGNAPSQILPKTCGEGVTAAGFACL